MICRNFTHLTAGTLNPLVTGVSVSFKIIHTSIKWGIPLSWSISLLIPKTLNKIQLYCMNGKCNLQTPILSKKYNIELVYPHIN